MRKVSQAGDDRIYAGGKDPKNNLTTSSRSAPKVLGRLEKIKTERYQAYGNLSVSLIQLFK